MPIHDWRRASDAVYHSFQLGWAVELGTRLNGGLLPPSYFAMTETVELRPASGFADLSEPTTSDSQDAEDDDWPGEMPPPRTAFRFVDDRTQYACRVVTVRDDLRQPVSAVLFLTRQDKETPYRLDSILRLAVGAVTRGIHMLLVDLFPPSLRQPGGIHKLIWDRLAVGHFELPPDKPLILAAYSSGTTITGYIEPVGVGDPLPDMPIFLTPDRYVPCPLEATYQASWDVFPQALKEPLLAPPG